MIDHWLGVITAVALGGCVGSFVNVLVHRLPEGLSLLRPPSSCPVCGRRIPWYLNLPFSWFYLGGRCRDCSSPIPFWYPFVEGLCAALFAGLYVAYFMTGLRPEFAALGPVGALPVFLLHLFLAGMLVAALLIDARHFIIPLVLPWSAIALALAAVPATLWLEPVTHRLVAHADGGTVGAAAGGTAGLIVAIGLLAVGLLPRSFAFLDDADPPPDAGEEAEAPAGTEAEAPEPAAPSARREMLWEGLFLLLPVVGAAAGGIGWTPAVADAVTGFAGGRFDIVAGLGGTLFGLLAGGGIVWATRIVGTLAFGKEAMGLGDVHLLAAVGAVLGAADALLAFLLAPFFGLAIVLVTAVAQRLKGVGHVVPYGPYLATATLAVMAFREPIVGFLFRAP